MTRQSDLFQPVILFIENIGISLFLFFLSFGLLFFLYGFAWFFGVFLFTAFIFAHFYLQSCSIEGQKPGFYSLL